MPIAAVSGSSSTSAATTNGALEKGTLKTVKGDKPEIEVDFMFNPTEYSFSKSNSWGSTDRPGRNMPKLAFTSGGAVQVSLELLFDTYEKGTDVREEYTKKIYKMTLVNESETDKEKRRPPRVTFSWGEVIIPKAVITSFSVSYTLFLPDGKPVRAKVSLSLQECEDDDEKSPQNPTSQGTVGYKIYIVKPGDTLDRIAFEEYNRSSEWRFLADVNNLEDPRVLRPGQALAIQPLES